MAEPEDRDSRKNSGRRRLSLSLSVRKIQANLIQDVVPWSFNGGIYKRSFRTEDGGRSALEEAFSRSVKIGKVLAWVNSLLKRLFLTRNCLKLVYTRTGGTSEIDSPPPPRPLSPTPGFRMRLIFLPDCVYSQRPGQRLVLCVAIMKKAFFTIVLFQNFLRFEMCHVFCNLFRVNTISHFSFTTVSISIRIVS